MVDVMYFLRNFGKLLNFFSSFDSRMYITSTRPLASSTSDKYWVNENDLICYKFKNLSKIINDGNMSLIIDIKYI